MHDSEHVVVEHVPSIILQERASVGPVDHPVTAMTRTHIGVWGVSGQDQNRDELAVAPLDALSQAPSFLVAVEYREPGPGSQEFSVVTWRRLTTSGLGEEIPDRGRVGQRQSEGNMTGVSPSTQLLRSQSR